MRAIVTGMIATYPVGGVAWDYGQYALGLEKLGFEVYYLEDTGLMSYDPRKGEYGEDCSYGVGFLKESLSRMSSVLGERWHFRSMNGDTFGIEASAFEAIVSETDLFLNVSGGTLLRDAYMRCDRKVLIETDPGWNHFVNFPKWDKSPGWEDSHGWRSHDHFFTYAERIGAADCLLPSLGIDWLRTRPIAVRDMWSSEPPGSTWTTVMTWNNFRQPIRNDGIEYGTKELEFPRVEELPRKTPAHLELAVGGFEPPVERWRDLGWSVVASEEVSQTLDDYRTYIQKSRGEFSVAKNVYVATRCGWFSCRSVCYLAAGRPVVVQDTGFSEIIKTGTGLLAFSSLEDAVEAIELVESDYDRHQRAAREICDTFFDSSRVLSDLVEAINL